MNDFLYPKEKAFNNSSCLTSERLFLTTLYKANSPNSSLIILHLSLSWPLSSSLLFTFPHWNISLSGQALVLVLLGVCLTWCPAPNRCSEMLVEWVDGMQRDLSPFHIVIIFLSMSREAGTEAELCLCCPRGYRQQSSQVLSLEDLRQRLTLLGQMRRHLRGVSLLKLRLYNSRQIWALSGSSVTLSGWIYSHRFAPCGQRKPCGISAVHTCLSEQPL